MKFWLSKNGEIPLREQIMRQVVLAITAGDLRAGEKLPSVREMALRYDVHSNTVSAAYVSLESEGWVVSRKGSGVFVAEKSPGEIENAAENSEAELDAMILQFAHAARTRGFALEQIVARLETKLKKSPIKQISLVESDPELRKILICEIESKIDLPITEMSLASFTVLPDAIVVAREETAAKISFAGAQICLRLNSVQNEMRGKQRPAACELVGVVSRWETFLNWSKTMLVAAGIGHEQIVLRNAQDTDWQRGLSACAYIIADALTAAEMPKNVEVRVFRLIAEESLIELQTLIN